MNAQAAAQFSKWLAQEHPELFVALYRRAQPSIVKTLEDFSDLLSSIGTGLTTAVSTVGSFLTSAQGQQTISALGAAYLQSKAAQQAVNTNLSRAQAGLAPAPIQTVYNPQSGQYEAVLPGQSSGSYIPLAQAQGISPGFSMNSVPTWVWAAGGGLLLALVVRSFLR